MMHHRTASKARSWTSPAPSARSSLFERRTKPGCVTANHVRLRSARNEITSGTPEVASSAEPAEQMTDSKKCLDDCETQFNDCIKHSDNPMSCMAARSVCQRNCPPSKEEPAPAPKKECSAPHPTGLHTIGHLEGGQSYGFVTIHTWKSSSGDLAALKDCTMSENITYSKIPNPPYGLADGQPVAESGTTERSKEKVPVTGKGKDTHRAPSEWVGNPPRSEGSFTVTQTYDYKCAGCGNDWVPFAHYLITSKVYKEGDQWKHKMTKVGSEEQKGDSEEVVEDIG